MPDAPRAHFIRQAGDVAEVLADQASRVVAVRLAARARDIRFAVSCRDMCAMVASVKPSERQRCIASCRVSVWVFI